MIYKPQTFINVVLQCLVDKYVITYQNIWSEGVVRPQGVIVTLGNVPGSKLSQIKLQVL